jgi:hypothetical protein
MQKEKTSEDISIFKFLIFGSLYCSLVAGEEIPLAMVGMPPVSGQAGYLSGWYYRASQ